MLQKINQTGLPPKLYQAVMIENYGYRLLSQRVTFVNCVENLSKNMSRLPRKAFSAGLSALLKFFYVIYR
jgi:hypothetical protein